MAERGLPTGLKMRHDSHYVEELARGNRTVGKVLPIDSIEPNPLQPRTEIGDLEELTASIKEKGVLEPLLVKPRNNGTYMIIAGERRWRASNAAGLKEVPCIELDIEDKEIAEIALVENLQRKDLTIWEVADGLADLTERFGYTHDDIAEKIGKSRSTVTESLAIASLPDDVRERCVEGEITAKSILIEISRQFDEKAMHALLDEILEKDLNRSEIRLKTKPQGHKPAAAPARVRTAEAKIIDKPEEDSAKTFQFESESGTFDLTIRFKGNDDEFGRKEVLIALKEAFDAVKSKP